MRVATRSFAVRLLSEKCVPGDPPQVQCGASDKPGLGAAEGPEILSGISISGIDLLGDLLIQRFEASQ